MNPQMLIQEVETLLIMMGIKIKEVSIKIDTDIKITIISIRVSGTEMEIFTENYNTLTRDFGIILKQFLEKKHHYFKDIIIDVNGENIKFIEATKEKAAIAVERVQFFDKPYEFGFLNGYERMLIHSYLKNTPEIITESHGEGRDRRLVIKKK